jgi:hypothetical protein
MTNSKLHIPVNQKNPHGFDQYIQQNHYQQIRQKIAFQHTL